MDSIFSSMRNALAKAQQFAQQTFKRKRPQSDETTAEPSTHGGSSSPPSPSSPSSPLSPSPRAIRSRGFKRAKRARTDDYRSGSSGKESAAPLPEADLQNVLLRPVMECQRRHQLEASCGPSSSNSGPCAAADIALHLTQNKTGTADNARSFIP